MTNATGVDLSYANAGDPHIDGLTFVIARATYGTQKDSRYEQHKAAARSKGQIFGAYAFGVYGSGTTQAAAFLKAAGVADFYVLDLEVEAGKPRMTNTQALAFIAYVKKYKGRCLLYHSDSGFPYLGQTDNWVAKWGSTAPARTWRIWQWHGAPLDRDLFHGTPAAMRLWSGTTPPPVVSATKYKVSIFGPVALYDKPYGRIVGTVTKATYTCTRAKVNGLWWYRILDGSATTHGRYFKASSQMTAHLV